MKITRRMWGMAAGAMLALNLGLPAQAAEEAPDALVKRVSADVLETIRRMPRCATATPARSMRWSTRRSCLMWTFAA